MVSAELAVVLPVLVLVVVALLAGLRAGADQLRCVEAARVAARELARGTDPAEARRQALRVAPAGATVSAAPSGTDVRVTVAVRVGLGPLPAVELSASAVTPREPDPGTGASP